MKKHLQDRLFIRKKKIDRNFLAFIGLCLAVALGFYSCASIGHFEGNYKVTVKGKKNARMITIIGYNGMSQEIVIPDAINAIPVTSIGAWAFHKTPLPLTAVIIPEGVVSIEQGAFRGNNLTVITIPDSVISIGEQAFAMNTLTVISIPSGVASIGRWAFAQNEITSITIGSMVLLDPQSFDNNFALFYNQGGKQAGTYVYHNGSWGFDVP